MTPSRFGKYEIVKQLATGGMAEIYLARATAMAGLHKLVVIKRMLPELAARGGEFVEMFLDEARIAATLQHSNIVQTFDVGVEGEHPFMAMEYLQGEDVRSLMHALTSRQERLPVEHALNIIIGVCAGLDYAHEKVDFDGRALNIVHRDVTPQNVIVTYEGGVKLLDFGIAKAANRAGRTRYGTIKGKVPYMSPEQCRGEALDRRSDLFSVGILLYELTLSRRLFRGQGDYDVLKQIVEGVVTPPRQIDPAYDPVLEAIVMRALEKDRARRFQTARELQAALEAVALQARLPISSLALKQFMERLYGRKIEVLNEATAGGDLELLSVVITRLASTELEELEDTGTAPGPGSEALATTVARPAPRTEPALTPPRRRPRVLAGVAIAAALGVAAGWVYRGLRAPAPATPVVVETPQAEPRAAPPAPPVVAPVEPPVVAPPAPPVVTPLESPPPRPPALSPRGAASKPSPRTSPRPLAPPVPPPAPVGTGTLALATSPACRVTIDGVGHGVTPVRLDLPAGPHEVALENAEYRIARRLRVTITPGQTLTKNLDFGE